MQTAKDWYVRGQYCESCNCDILCPCITSNTRAMPTRGNCDVMLGFHIEDGDSDGISLDGLSFVIALQTPGPMIEGLAIVAVYLDDKADHRQRQALQAIVGGQSGGPPSLLMDAVRVKEMKGFKYVPINFRMVGNKRSLEIPGVMEMGVEGIEGISGNVMEINNTRHIANTNVAVARTIYGTYQDFDFDWDNAGKNAHYASFSWKGSSK